MSGILPQLGLDEENLKIVLVGKTGVGKSSVMNTLKGEEEIRTRAGAASVTTKIEVAKVTHGGQELVIIDTPGLLNTRKKEDVEKDIAKSILCAAADGGPHVFLLVLRADAITSQDEHAVKVLKKIFGDKYRRYTLVLFTHGGRCRPKSTEEAKKEFPFLKKFLHDDDSMHFFENKEKDEGKRNQQVSGLVEKINKMVAKNTGKRYTTKMLEDAEKILEKTKTEEKCMSGAVDIFSKMVEVIEKSCPPFLQQLASKIADMADAYMS
ncbi:GTPase IMAP family member 7 isoform X2 [Etheostoma spectabile]|uniref:GTPase IMAP family member 7 isoform X2 n=1 Tax=Etheostoma spectabile TaxID=54343 RepID=UPI0013AE8CC0|nr:GTPase IMAP family member 7-like isoform X2 [Etheostoma spectabile]